jgi:hypothetical protein
MEFFVELCKPCCPCRRKKKGKLLLSHRYNPLPLLRSHPGGVQEELVVKDLPRHKDIQKVDMD